MDKMTKQFGEWLQTPAGLTFARVFGNVLKSVFLWVTYAHPEVLAFLGIGGVKPETISEYAVPVAVAIVAGVSWAQAHFNNKRIRRALMTPPPLTGESK